MNRDGRDSRVEAHMSRRKFSWVEKIVDLLSRGSIPVDGGYWVNSHGRRASVPRAEHSRVPPLNSQPLSRQHCV
jgi:hypothetical protein